MAKIKEEIYVIKLSKLVSDKTADLETIADSDFNANLQAIVQEMIGTNIIVEIEAA